MYESNGKIAFFVRLIRNLHNLQNQPLTNFNALAS